MGNGVHKNKIMFLSSKPFDRSSKYSSLDEMYKEYLWAILVMNSLFVWIQTFTISQEKKKGVESSLWRQIIFIFNAEIWLVLGLSRFKIPITFRESGVGL